MLTLLFIIKLISLIRKKKINLETQSAISKNSMECIEKILMF